MPAELATLTATESEAPPAPAEPKRWFDRYNGNRIPVADRCRIMDRLALKVPHAQIEREVGVSADVIKAIAEQQSDTIEQRKATLMDQAFRIAGKAYDRVEDTIDTAPLAQASVVAGIFSEKALLLAGEPTQRIEITVTSADNLYGELKAIQAKLESNEVVEGEFTKLES